MKLLLCVCVCVCETSLSISRSVFLSHFSQARRFQTRKTRNFKFELLINSLIVEHILIQISNSHDRGYLGGERKKIAYLYKDRYILKNK